MQHSRIRNPARFGGFTDLFILGTTRNAGGTDFTDADTSQTFTLTALNDGDIVGRTAMLVKTNVAGPSTATLLLGKTSNTDRFMNAQNLLAAGAEQYVPELREATALVDSTGGTANGTMADGLTVTAPAALTAANPDALTATAIAAADATSPGSGADATTPNGAEWTAGVTLMNELKGDYTALKADVTSIRTQLVAAIADMVAVHGKVGTIVTDLTTQNDNDAELAAAITAVRPELYVSAGSESLLATLDTAGANVDAITAGEVWIFAELLRVSDLQTNLSA